MPGLDSGLERGIEPELSGNGLSENDVASAEANVRRFAREETKNEEETTIVTEFPKIEFDGEQPRETLAARLANNMEEARNTQNPELTLRLVLEQSGLPKEDIAHIREQVVTRARNMDWPLMEAFNKAEDDTAAFWEVPATIADVSKKDVVAINTAVNNGDQGALENLRIRMPISYEVTIQEIFKTARLKAEVEDNMRGAMEYLNKIPGMHAEPAFKVQGGITLVRTSL